MFSRLLFLFAASFLLSTTVPAFAEKSMSKAEVEGIVHDYIMNNPKTILESVDEYQKKTVQLRQDAALAKNKDKLAGNDGTPEAGAPGGDATVVEFFDYNCGYCKKVFPEVKKLLEKDKKVRVIFRDFPILGPSSENAAKWALAAQKQKKYYAFHTAMMENRKPIDDDLLAETAKSVGMDAAQAKKDAEGTEILMQIEKNRLLANDLGITGTPAFIIGDTLAPGAISLEEMEKRIAAQRGAKKR